MSVIRRIFVEKKKPFAVEAMGLLKDLQINLGIQGLTDLRIYNRYDVMGLSENEFLRARQLVLSEPPVDTVIEENIILDKDEQSFAVELLPGQYDQREDFAEQCIQLITQKDRPIVSAAKVYVVKGDISKGDLKRIKSYCINPVEAREAVLFKPTTLVEKSNEPEDVKVLDNFINLDKKQAEKLRKDLGLAMSLEDVLWCQKYFKDEEHRNPTITEIRVLDTYWSDHCRHTTFMTELDNITVENCPNNQPIDKAFAMYKNVRKEVYGKDTNRPMTLMDIACIETKKLKKEGKIPDLDESEEINACSIVVPIKVDEKIEDWLVMFKNETHNHPTEIEPFGGAATCLGGAIRDPLSGRSYVYQAMRITGAADPRTAVSDTIEGKLPQRKITIGAASGYSSYGNQIGLATGYVQEFFHPRFVAKRMEIGAVIGAVPQKAVKRERPQKGDIVVLLGGRTGRDGCGGATGASKEHTIESLTTCGAEVQKGNAPTERKIQRLFRNNAVTSMIKRCNDFGAGGVSVAIGELTDGLNINLDMVPKKYDGLDGTELAISESQERMAVVVSATDKDAFISYADKENLEATVVAEVTDNNRLVMTWRGKKIVDLSRKFLDTNGVAQHTEVKVQKNDCKSIYGGVPDEVVTAKNIKDKWLKNLGRLNVCSQKGLVERFDSTIGRGTVHMPYGGKNQLTLSEGMVARIPVLNGVTDAVSIMTSGYNPDVACNSPFHGAIYAVVQSIVKAVALGADPDKIRLTLQEYFPKLHDDKSWGEPFSALLGSFIVLNEMGLPAIGGKDSMSGTFMDKTVPPTLVSFAVGFSEGKNTVSAEFKKAGDKVVLIKTNLGIDGVPDFVNLKNNLRKVHELILKGELKAVASVKDGGVAATVTTLCFGNGFGFNFESDWSDEDLFSLRVGDLLAEVENEKILEDLNYLVVGEIVENPVIQINGINIDLDEALVAYRKPLQNIFPDSLPKVKEPENLDQPLYKQEIPLTAPYNVAKPRVFIPIFPGINCEYDSARAFEMAGAIADTFVVRNLSAQAIEESVQEMVKYIDNSQIVMIPGGFSAGDEPDGSGKFIATMLRNPRIKDAIGRLLNERDGLMLGICNGFQALIKLGLVPYGEIKDMIEDSPTLTFNNIGRHVSQIVSTKVVSNKSPWLMECQPGDIFSIPVSHGEGRFYAPEATIKELFAKGQIATQYVDLSGHPTMNTPFNPNGSLYAIEGITSEDGRVLGKMGHSERFTDGLFRNIYGNKDQHLFVSGVKYFK